MFSAKPEGMNFVEIKVLLIEGQESNTILMGRLFSKLACRVDLAVDESMAYRACEKTRYDFVFMKRGEVDGLTEFRRTITDSRVDDVPTFLAYSDENSGTVSELVPDGNAFNFAPRSISLDVLAEFLAERHAIKISRSKEVGGGEDAGDEILRLIQHKISVGDLEGAMPLIPQLNLNSDHPLYDCLEILKIGAGNIVRMRELLRTACEKLDYKR